MENVMVLQGKMTFVLDDDVNIGTADVFKL